MPSIGVPARGALADQLIEAERPQRAMPAGNAPTPGTHERVGAAQQLVVGR